MMNNLNNEGIKADAIFTDSFLDAKILYLYHFNRLPDMDYIGYVDGEKTFKAIHEKFAGEIKNIHRKKWYARKEKKFAFDITVIVLDNNCIIELDSGYCEILHDGQRPELVATLAATAIQFKERQRRQPLEINLVVQTRSGLQLKGMEIKRTRLDIGLFYEDDFAEVDQAIRKRLSNKNDKGIVLLHGLPGTGKTTYLRYLVGKIKKRVLFVSPSVAGNLMNPDFIELLIRNPDTVLIIEDAENIIMDRRHASSSSVFNLLNISDGLLADFLNVQLICTFNSALHLVDPALLRKGRLIAKYEFGKLGMQKARALSKHLGYDTEINEAMTIAEIANPQGKNEEAQPMEVIGFRRQTVEMN